MSKQNEITEQELAKIREYTRKDVTADEIYTFSLILCDNETDRDNEKFTEDSLNKLAGMFVGKTGIFDHNMSAGGQTARIYSAAVEKDPSRKTSDGDDYICVKAKAYMMRTAANENLIAEIEGGIKKETSVGCSVRSIRCSICGNDIRTEKCGHRKGETYGSKKCSWLLCDPEDAYEWSFVAVPSQRNAGVIKSHKIEDKSKYPDWVEEFRQEMKQDIIKDGAGLLPFLGNSLLGDICDCLSLKKLREMRDALKEQRKKQLPLVSLLAAPAEETAADYSDYKI